MNHAEVAAKVWLIGQLTVLYPEKNIDKIIEFVMKLTMTEFNSLVDSLNLMGERLH